MNKIIISIVTMIAFAGLINAQVETLNTKAEVMSTLSMVTDTDFNFGTLQAGSIDTTFQLDDADNTTVLSGNGFHSNDGATGKYTITAQAGSQVYISVSPTGTLTDGTTTLNATYSSNEEGANTLGAVSNSLVFKVGGTITVPSTATAGKYAGTFNVTYNY